jgi:tetratricopeptide (TPR) repeat protein
MEKALDLDPLSPVINYSLGDLYYAKRDYNKAVEPYRRAAQLGPPYTHWGLAIAHGKAKMFEEMRQEFAVHVRLVQDAIPFISTYNDTIAAFLEGDEQTLRRLLPELETHFQEAGAWAFKIAEFWFFLGENDKGFDWLERSYSMREFHLMEMRTSEELDSVRDDPRYLDLVKRLGLD